MGGGDVKRMCTKHTIHKYIGALWLLLLNIHSFNYMEKWHLLTFIILLKNYVHKIQPFKTTF